MKALDNFDYRVSCDDFLLYELGRLIDEDKASFDEEEFHAVIRAGIYEHIERRLDIRAEMAMRVRAQPGVRPGRLLQAIEDIESQLRDFPEIIENYTAYLFARLEECAALESDERITSAADTLLEFSSRESVEGALEILASNPGSVSARLLAHVISEPLLPEDLEAKAYLYVRSMWPLSRNYILYLLKPHTHEDLPFRWFQLLIESDEPSAVDRILEEVLVHGDDPNFREDLIAIIELLAQARDPEREEKILQVLNSEGTSRAGGSLLEDFLKHNKTQRHEEAKPEAWAALDRAYEANRKYLEAARLFDSGKIPEAARTLDVLLQKDPYYPFALMLRNRCRI